MFSKLYCKIIKGIINEKLMQWAVHNDILTDAKVSFKTEFKPLDAIFMLSQLVEKQLKIITVNYFAALLITVRLMLL